jgi:hypothetical protein
VSGEAPLSLCCYSAQFVFPENAAYFGLSWLEVNEMENIVLFVERKKEVRTQGNNPYRTLVLSLPKQSVFRYIHYVDACQCYVSFSLSS